MKLYKNNGDLLIDHPYCETVKEVVERAIANYICLVSVNLLDANLQNTNLSYTDLQKANLINANFINANLSNTKFIYADLSYAKLINADLSGTLFSNTKVTGLILPLKKYDIPIIVDIHKKVFEACSVKETFDMRTWCKTTKCIAGWVCTLAAKRGLALAKEIGFDAAASLIYMRSDPKIERLPNYYASNEDALKELEMLANRRG